MRNSKLMDECVEYFKSRPVYKKLFQKIRKKYAGLGHFGGTVALTRLTDEDKRHLGGFFRKDYHENQTVTISSKLMDRALSESRFSELCWEEILECYFEEPLRTKKEDRQEEQEKQQEFFAQILRDAGGRSGCWLQKVLEKRERGRQMLTQQYKEDPEEFRETLMNTCKAIDTLPVWEGKTERLAVFSAKITGNPHFFDDGTLGERLLAIYLLSVFSEKEPEGTRAERKNSLLYYAGILKDDLSNFVLVYGILGNMRSGQKHKGMEGFCDQMEPMVLTLHTLSDLKEAKALEAAERKIYVLENPAVFSSLVERYPHMAAVCTNGQPRLSTLVLMDLLREKHVFYYAGDFDPEGLMIAQNLKQRYPENLKLWGYQKKNYQKAVSKVEISERRLRMLDKIWMEELQEIKTAIREEKKAAYQENMMEVYQI